jgi:thiamine-monophosphate kinase
MAVRPLAAFISLVLPHRGGAGMPALPLAIAWYEGLLPLGREFGVAVAGGDTNTYDGPLVISLTALGDPTERGPLLRSGGKVDDWLLVTGKLGGSILGHHLDFTPRVREALLLHKRYTLHAGIDISDGLSLDASRLAAASGCGALLFLHNVPVSTDAYELARREGADDHQATALKHALSDGQDFELLIAAPPAAAQAILRDQPLDCPITQVGRLIEAPGLWNQDITGERLPLKPIGWLHK